MVRPLAEPAGVRRDLRHGARVRRVRDWRRFVGHVQPRRRDELVAGRGLSRAARGGRVSVDDRRRVRLVDRFHDRLRGHDGRAAVGVLPLADLACDPVRVRGLDAARRAERLSRDEDAPAVVHRHARVPLHPARAHARALDHVRRSHDHLRGRRSCAERLDHEHAVSWRSVPRTLHVARTRGHRQAARQRRAARAGHSESDPLVVRARRGQRVHPREDALRQLDSRGRRRCERREECRRAGQAREDFALRADRVLLVPVRRAAGVRHRVGGGGSRPAEGIRGDHRGGHRRNAVDGRLWLGDRRMLRRVDLRRRADRHHLYQRELRLVPRVPRRDAADRRAVQSLRAPSRVTGQ